MDQPFTDTVQEVSRAGRIDFNDGDHHQDVRTVERRVIARLAAGLCAQAEVCLA
jgi:hypothetical protein